MMMHNFRFIDDNKCPAVVPISIVGEVGHVWEQGIYGNSFVLSVPFYFKSKSALKAHLLKNTNTS